MGLCGALRNHRLATPVADAAKIQSMLDDGHTVQLKSQLDLWNSEWGRILAEVPYYRDLANRSGIPNAFTSWQEFCALVPPMTRSMVQSSGEALWSNHRRPDFFRITGGTTGEPVQMPAWRSEKRQALVDIWQARRWFGLVPSSRLFLLWGHSHILGSGISGWWNRLKRTASDAALGYRRFSAYDLGAQAMQKCASEMIEWRPDYVLGYGVALDCFSRINEQRRSELRGLGVKVVIGAAEHFPQADTADRLSWLFGAPVAMEYGSVETNLIAHSDPNGLWRVFWRSYFLEAETAAGCAGRLRITSLYPRCFPLIRYEIGDDVELDTQCSSAIGLRTFSRVIGRCNGPLITCTGTPVHSEVFAHAVRDLSSISAYQIVQRCDILELHLLARTEASSTTVDLVRRRLRRANPALESVAVRIVPALAQTRAGKTPTLVRL